MCDRSRCPAQAASLAASSGKPCASSSKAPGALAWTTAFQQAGGWLTRHGGACRGAASRRGLAVNVLRTVAEMRCRDMAQRASMNGG